MICPKCGKELNNDILFCEHCGEEIRIVRDFDPELDGIVSDYSVDAGNVAEKVRSEELEKLKDSFPGEKHKSFNVRVRNWFLAGFVFVLLLSGGIYLYHHFSGSYQYETALGFIERKNYSEAERFALRAVKLEPENTEYMTALLACLVADNNTEQARELCLRIIELDGSSQQAYRTLISIYESENAYAQINELLKACTDEQIISIYSSYLVKAPEFSEQPGAYDETFSLKMIANTKGTIYYTMDGSVPDENSEIYTAPVKLENGYYQVRAVFVNDYGVKSEEAGGVYYIDQTVPEPPVVLTEEDEYTVPTLIYVQQSENCAIYYTTDGTEPTKDSTQYSGPVPMPVGVSHFRFVNCSIAGILSEETECFFSLKLHASLSIEAAKNKLLIELMEAEVIKDMNGSVENGSGHNVYNYKYAVTISGRDFYLYREYYEDDAGNSAATGTEYVVDVMDGQCYKAVQTQNPEDEESYTEDPWSGLKLQNILSGSNPE